MKPKRFLLSISPVALVFGVLFSSCSDEESHPASTTVQQTKSGRRALSKSASFGSMSYTMTNTYQMESLPALKTSSVITGSQSANGIQSIVQSYAVAVSELGGVPNISMTRVNSPTGAVNDLLPSSKFHSITYDGSTVTIRNSSGVIIKQQSLPCSNGDVQSLSSSPKAGPLQEVFQDIFVEPTNLLENAAKVFDDVEIVGPNTYKFVKNLPQGSKEILFDSEKKVILSDKTIIGGNLVSQSTYEYGSFGGRTIRTKTNTQRFSYVNGKQRSTKATREITNVKVQQN